MTQNSKEITQTGKEMTTAEVAESLLKQLVAKQIELRADEALLANAKQLIEVYRRENTMLLLEMLTYTEEFGKLDDAARDKHLETVMSKMAERGIQVRKVSNG